MNSSPFTMLYTTIVKEIQIEPFDEKYSSVTLGRAGVDFSAEKSRPMFRVVIGDSSVRRYFIRAVARRPKIVAGDRVYLKGNAPDEDGDVHGAHLIGRTEFCRLGAAEFERNAKQIESASLANARMNELLQIAHADKKGD